MRIAIVSDIHGNQTALEAVLADLRETSPDLTLHGGDLPFGGSSPAAIVDRIRDLGWPGVLGNTDEMLFKPESLKEFDRIAMVDVQPHYFTGLIDRVDLVIDHHPEQTGYTAVYKDIRPDYGSTSTILTEHLRAVDVNISERTATAMLYAIKSDTLFFNRQTNRVDLEAFSYLYPLADAALIRKMEGAEITLERLEYVLNAYRTGNLTDQVFCAFLGPTPREDFIPYVADFFLQVEDVKWTIIAGVVNDSLIISVRNLGYTKNAGEFVRRYFADVGSAGGHRAMAKAVIAMPAFRAKFGDLSGGAIGERLQQLAHEFLQHEQPQPREVARVR